MGHGRVSRAFDYRARFDGARIRRLVDKVPQGFSACVPTYGDTPYSGFVIFPASILAGSRGLNALSP